MRRPTAQRACLPAGRQRSNGQRALTAGLIAHCSLLIALFAVPAQGAPWSGLLDPSRAIDWSQAGVVGGISSANWAQCGSTIAAGASASTINASIQSCEPNHYVQLGAGTFNLTTGLVMKSNVAVRGTGADQTFLVFSGADGCGGLWSVICFKDDLGFWGGSPETQFGGSHAATWSGGYAQGSTQITLTSVGSSGPSVGQYIYLDQANVATDNGNLFVCDNTAYPCSLEGGNGAREIGGVQYGQAQVVKVIGVSGNTYTIAPGLYSPNWSGSQDPGAWWSGMIQNAGLEDLSIDHTNSGEISGIGMENTFNCWVRGIRSLNSNRNHVWIAGGSSHNTVQDSYFYGTQNGASQSYGVEVYLGSDNLVVNNIFQRVTTPHMNSVAMGNVIAYNFSINDYEIASPAYLYGSMSDHNEGVEYNLFEGNNGSQFSADLFHGTGGMNTLFRNRVTGWESGKDNNMIPIRLDSYKRYVNVIGNVLGTSGIQNGYESGSQPIYALGGGNSENGVTVPDDPLVRSTLMRWGNYDTVNAASRFMVSEVPSGLSLYANSVPASPVLPESFYLAAKPGWWPSGKPWPPVGPDVAGGNIADLAGHAYTLLAQDCYTNIMAGPADGSGNPLSFNSSRCYASGGGSPPPPGTLPAPDLSGLNGKTFALTDELSFTYAVSGVMFGWAFTAAMSNEQRARSPTKDSSLIARNSVLVAQNSSLAGVPLPTTTAPRFTPSSLGLGPGTYQLTVTVSQGTKSVSATATITLVASDLSSVKVYPNPWRADRHAAHPSISFANLPQGSTVKIFTASGHLVRELSGSGTVAWDLANNSGDKVASGIYVYLITDKQGDKVRGKTGVIR